MKADKIYGVLTGDLVKSTLLSSRRNEILRQLKRILKSSSKLETKKNEFIVFSDIFRGDSFQGIISSPSSSLKVVLYIQAELLKTKIGEQQAEARIGIGLGSVDFFDKNKIEESNGEAFRYSGQALDRIKKYRRLSILSPSQELNRHLILLASCLDAIIQRWSIEQSEAVSLWLQGKTQESISKMLGIKQPAVHQRLQLAGHFAIRNALDYFKAIVDSYKASGLF